MAVRYAAERGHGELAKMAWRVLGPELEKCSSAKAETLIRDYADPVTRCGNKMITFTFFGQTVLPAVADRLRRARIKTYEYHGGMTASARDETVMAFRACPEGAVLLASDAASKGLNIPEASYTVEYEAARTHAVRTQRAGRAHRLGQADPTTFATFVLEGTAESARAVPKLLERNAESDYMLGDTGAEGYTTAEDRWDMFAQARKRKAPQA
jgi:superfamily II DNA/RNA helicase